MITALALIGIEWWDPAFRAESPIASNFAYVATTLTALGLVFLFIRQTWMGNIRTRLIFTYIGLVVVTAALIMAISSVLGAREAQERIIAQLESVTTLKEAEIQAWMANMQDDLIFILSNRDFLLDTREYLERSQEDLSLQSKSARCSETGVQNMMISSFWIKKAKW